MADTKTEKTSGRKIKVRLTSTCHVKGCEGTRGAIVEMPEKLAERLIERRGAIGVLAEAKAKTKREE